MPPKKKKPIANPVVVGTVSTRSTRRQSIVNIDIPKLSKSKTPKEIVKEPGTSFKTNKSKTFSKGLTEQINETYNKMIRRIVQAKSSTSKTSGFKVFDTNSVTKGSVNKLSFDDPIENEIKMYPVSARTSKSSLSSRKAASSEVEGTFKSNKALLQILEDWTDDDSQDVKKDNSEAEYSDIENMNKSFSSVDSAADTYVLNPESRSQNEAPGTDNNPYEVKKESIADENKVSSIVKMPKEEPESQICELTQIGNFGINEGLVEYIVEENEPVLEEPVEETVAFDESDYIVECVTEEIVAEENDIMDTVEDNSSSFVADDGEVHINETVVSTENADVKREEPELPHDVKDNVEPSGNIDTSRENEIFEETSQSVSTSDSNDAEVRSYFSKEIENNETVNEEDIPNIEQELTEERSCSNSGFDKNSVEARIIAELENSSNASEESSQESEKNSAVFQREQKEEISNVRVTRSSSKRVVLEEVFAKPDEHIYTKKNFRQEEILEIIGQGVEAKMFNRRKFEEKMDTTECTAEESLESKVAGLHLKDEDKTEEVHKEVAEVNRRDESKSTEIDINMEVDQTESTEDCPKMEAETLPVLEERRTTRRTRSTDLRLAKAQNEQLKETKSPKPVKSAKASKEKKIVKPKDIQPKEQCKDSKSKKKLTVAPAPTTKKTKDKTEKKEIVKSDKKETAKKVTKPDNDEAKKLVKTESMESEDTEVRRSSRIKSISELKKKTTGHGLVRSKSEPILNESDVSDSNSAQTESEKSTPSASPKVTIRERKTRWTRSSENLSSYPQSTVVLNKGDNHLPVIASMVVDEKPKLPAKDPVVEARLKQFVHLKENIYKTDRMTCKEAKKMTCDCFLTPEEIQANEYGCGEDCLNRLLLIECGNLCQVADRCTNKRFQKGQFAPVEVFNTEKKGLGLRAAANIPYGEFILEYVGEVLNCVEFDKRAEVYSEDKNIHYYFMSLRADAIIDATMKGNISRFINHSCDPNAETQKWTVNGELRIGFFSTRTILAGEEITFDYRFQRYGKEAQRCYCEASICRGWLGEQPDEDSEDEDEEEEEEEEAEGAAAAKIEEVPAAVEAVKIEDEQKLAIVAEDRKETVIKIEKEPEKTVPTVPITVKRKSPRKKPRKDLFEELDQLDEEIEMLITTGLKNQAHTLKLSRLMVRAKEPAQRAKLLRILRRGELPCRRLFLDYHGLRLMHGYMIDVQHLVNTDKKYESVRLEMLQTLAVLPIPNKTMLQDSKVLPTVEKWATNKDLGSPLDSDSNSPKTEQDTVATEERNKTKQSAEPPKKDDIKLEGSVEDKEEEIKFLATKLLEEWANLKEVFRIPKKERIEQMKEHEREANKKFMQSGYGGEQDSNRKNDRYRHFSRYKLEREGARKNSKSGEKPSPEFIRLSKIERRKLFALQHELKEEERRMKQRELWRQHELNCLMIGTDPRFTAPFDPSRGYQCIWNPQIGQWQNYPLPPQNQTLFTSQPPTPISNPIPSISLPPPPLPNLSLPPPQLQIAKSIPSFFPPPQIGIPTSLNGGISQLPTSMGLTGQVQPPTPTSVPQMHVQQQMPSMPTIPPIPTSVSQINSMQGIPGALPQNIPTHPQIPASISSTPVPVVQYQEPIKKEEDPSQVKFMGPIPPPVKLPPKWKCAKDKYGRPYYYHVKIRKSQWEPPPFVPPSPEEAEEFSASETESSSDTSSVTSDTSSENSDSDEEVNDSKLLVEVKRQMEKSSKVALKTIIPEHIKTEEMSTPSPDDRISDEDMDTDLDTTLSSSFIDDEKRQPIDIRLKEQFDLLKDDKPSRKRRRLGLCEEIPISPRTEEDKLQFKEDLKRYKANKEKLKRQKELIMQQTRKQLREVEAKKLREKRPRTTVKSRIKEMPDFNSETAKKIKENFRSNMASTVVGSLNGYRKPDCKEGRITNTEDFKHLARKLTHFVMLKEMKHIARIEDLTCTDNVKSKAREYIKKYMSKFGETYIKRNDSPDFKD